MRFRHSLKVGAFALLILAAAALALLRWHLSHRVDRAIEAIRAQGCPVTLEELDAWYPEPPAGENAADALLPALFLPVGIPEESRDLIPIAGKAELPPRTEPIPPEMRDNIWQVLAANRDAIRMIHEASRLPGCRWPIACLEGMNVPLPHLARIREGSRLLALDTLLYAEDGDGQAAVDSMVTGCWLAGTLAEEPVLISQLVRVACLGITVSSLERTLNRTALPEEEMARLSAAFVEAENPVCFTRALAGERCMVLSHMREGGTADLFGGGANSRESFSSAVGVIVTGAYKALGIADMDTHQYLLLTGLVIDVVSQPYGGRQTSLARVTNVVDNVPWYCPLTRVLGPSLSNSSEAMDRLAAQLRTARLALAVERYRAAHGDLPDTADALVPEFMESVPIDPCSGEPIRYKVLPHGYATYSLAKNGVDDGGVENEEPKKAWEEGDITFTVERE